MLNRGGEGADDDGHESNKGGSGGSHGEDIPHGAEYSRRLSRATAATSLGVCANLGTMLLIVRPAAAFF